jgi:hypothetical protein
MRIRVLLLFGLLACGSVSVGIAQDEDLDPLLALVAGGDEEVDARSYQIYRIPISFPIRKLENHPWGLRIILPISLGVHELQAATDFGDLFDRLGTAAIIPGVEALVPIGENWLLKPFGEVGVGSTTSGGDVELLYGAGLRTRGNYRAGAFHLMPGGAVQYRNPGTGRSEFDSYFKFELGADAQLGLGSLGSKQARGGAFGIVRHFTDIEIPRLGRDPISIQRQYELGLSFSTEPVLKLWKLRLPWIAVGYRFGDVFTGFRLYLSFPF